jgi:hypothetical protein
VGGRGECVAQFMKFKHSVRSYVNQDVVDDVRGAQGAQRRRRRVGACRPRKGGRGGAGQDRLVHVGVELGCPSVGIDGHRGARVAPRVGGRQGRMARGVAGGRGRSAEGRWGACHGYRGANTRGLRFMEQIEMAPSMRRGALSLWSGAAEKQVEGRWLQARLSASISLLPCISSTICSQSPPLDALQTARPTLLLAAASRSLRMNFH